MAWHGFDRDLGTLEYRVLRNRVPGYCHSASKPLPTQPMKPNRAAETSLLAINRPSTGHPWLPVISACVQASANSLPAVQPPNEWRPNWAVRLCWKKLGCPLKPAYVKCDEITSGLLEIWPFSTFDHSDNIIHKDTVNTENTKLWIKTISTVLASDRPSITMTDIVLAMVTDLSEHTCLQQSAILTTHTDTRRLPMRSLKYFHIIH